jgi:hypothetical protein
MIVLQMVGSLQWEVNEQCVQHGKCDQIRAFIDAGKPVFHIEYPDSALNVDAATKGKIC